MSGSQVFAKEIIDKVKNGFKDLRKGDATESPSVPRIEPRAEEDNRCESYKPSTNFDKIFSGLIGNKPSGSYYAKPVKRIESKTSSQNLSSNETANREPPEREVKEAAQETQLEDKEAQPTSPVTVFEKLFRGQQQEKSEAQVSQAENSGEDPAASSVSIFKRLSLEQVKEDAVKPSPQIKDKRDEATSTPASVFKRLSMEPQQEREVTQSPQTETNPNDHPSRPISVFKKLSQSASK